MATAFFKEKQTSKTKFSNFLRKIAPLIFVNTKLTKVNLTTYQLVWSACACEDWFYQERPSCSTGT